MKGGRTNRLTKLSQELHDILAEQQLEIRKVIDGLRLERRAFVSGSGDVLQKSLLSLENQAARAQELGRRQKEILGEISGFLGVPVHYLTAKRIASAMEGKLGQQLILQADCTKQVAKELEVERRVGETLLDWSSQCQEGLLRQITEAYEDPSVYSATGAQGKADKSARLFDAKV